MHAVRTILSEDIVTGAAPSAAHVLEDPPVVNWKVTSRLITIYMTTVRVSPRATTKVLTVTGTSAPPTRIRTQEIVSPRGYIVTKKVRNAYPFKTSNNRFSPEHRNPTPMFSKLISHKTFPDESADVNSYCGMDFERNSVISESSNFMDFGI